MKKMLAWVLCAALMLSVAAGCSGGTAETSGSSGGESSTASETPVSTEPDDESSEESPSSEGSDEESTELDYVPVDDDMQKLLEQEADVLSGGTTVEGYVYSPDTEDAYMAVHILIDAGDYDGPDAINKATVQYGENVCRLLEDGFSYKRLYFTVVVDNYLTVTSFGPSYKDGAFVTVLGPIILEDDYEGLEYLLQNSVYFAENSMKEDLSDLTEYFDGDVVTAVKDDCAVVYIPIEEVTGENILNAYHVFTDEDEILSLYATIEVCKIYTDLEKYRFSVCTTDGEQVIDMTLTCTDEKYEYDMAMDYNDKYYSAVSDFNDLLSELAS